MLSVLIPTYNYVVIPLVKPVHQQLIATKIPFEIICFDNGSGSNANILNDEINRLEFCTFISLKKDGGRSKIRNLLAERAKYKWLLYLDADVLPVSDKFITNYIDSAKSIGQKVVFGGLRYEDKPDDDKTLRWVYGKSREEISLKVRKRDPEKHFTSANFLIDKMVFQEFKFDESLTEYGHEDTLLAIELNKKGIHIGQIDNPVYHLGLDKNEIFIEKTKRSVENLFALYQRQKITIQDNRFLEVFDKLKRSKLSKAFSFAFKKYSKNMEGNLNSKKPSLFIYDLYKMGYLCYLSGE